MNEHQQKSTEPAALISTTATVEISASANASSSKNRRKKKSNKKSSVKKSLNEIETIIAKAEALPLLSSKMATAYYGLYDYLLNGSPINHECFQALDYLNKQKKLLESEFFDLITPESIDEKFISVVKEINLVLHYKLYFAAAKKGQKDILDFALKHLPFTQFCVQVEETISRSSYLNSMMTNAYEYYKTSKDSSILNMLLEYGANPNVYIEYGGSTLLMDATR